MHSISKVLERINQLNQTVQIKKLQTATQLKKSVLSTSSLTIPSFQGDPTIFHKGIFLKQTPHIKN